MYNGAKPKWMEYIIMHSLYCTRCFTGNQCLYCLCLSTVLYCLCTVYYLWTVFVTVCESVSKSVWLSRAGTEIVSRAARDRVDHYLTSLKQYFAGLCFSVQSSFFWHCIASSKFTFWHVYVISNIWISSTPFDWHMFWTGQLDVQWWHLVDISCYASIIKCRTSAFQIVWLTYDRVWQCRVSYQSPTLCRVSAVVPVVAALVSCCVRCIHHWSVSSSLSWFISRSVLYSPVNQSINQNVL